MVLIEHVVMKNCRLCHTKPGLHDIYSDKKLIKDIYECVKVKVNDKSMNFLPRSVCEECKKTIKCFVSYKQQVRKVDQCLKKILKRVESRDQSEEQFKCSKCPGEFNNQEVFNKHLTSHSSSYVEDSLEINVTCPLCRTVFKDLEQYESHPCSAGIKECADDEESHKDSEDIRDSNVDEEKVKLKNGKYVCNYQNCKKVLSSAYTLKTHELKHEGKRSFLCVTCGKGFMTRNSLTCHEKIHLEVKGYICKLCNIGFSVRSNLRAHEKKHHEGVRFYCSQCTKEFSSKCSLERHERIHTGIKDFKCETCPSAFYTRKELLKHQRYHQGLRLHKCDECFKTFFERHHLIIHLRSHTGERPYVCKFPDCGKSFAESQKLKRHHNAKHVQM